MGLRNHEQYQHGVPGHEPANSYSATPTRVKSLVLSFLIGLSKLSFFYNFRYTNGVLVEPINTAAMKHATATQQTPFALLRPLNGIPVLVRVLSAGDKQVCSTENTYSEQNIYKFFFLFQKDVGTSNGRRLKEVWPDYDFAKLLRRSRRREQRKRFELDGIWAKYLEFRKRRQNGFW